MSTQKLPESQGIRLLRQLFLQGKRIFSTHDALEAATIQKIPHKQVNKVISNLSKQGRVFRLRRGLYVGIGLIPDQNYVHPFVIAIHLVQPSAISHWSALHYHGLIEQIPQIVTASTINKVITPSMREKRPEQLRTKHSFKINNISYEYITIQKKHFFGIEKIWLDEYFQIPITDKERTLLDLFVYHKMFGGIGEALGILEYSLPTIDIQKLVSYASKYNKKSVAKRLGWAMEYFGTPILEIEPLLKIPIKYYCRLDPSGPRIGPCDRRWMIQNNLIKSKNK